MVLDLAQSFDELARCLPQDPKLQREAMVLSKGNLPRPDSVMTSRRLCATWNNHFYGEFPVGGISWECDRPTARHLGLWMLATVQHRPAAEVTLELEHPRSLIKHIVLATDCAEDVTGSPSRPSSFNYRAQHPQRYPWLDSSIPLRDLPVLKLANPDTLSKSGDVGSSNLVRERLTGFGTDRGVTVLAELLLNVGLPSNPRVEYRLEGELGFGGVGPGSAELSLWLPGGFGHLGSEFVD